VVDSLSGWPLAGVRAIVVLSPAGEHLAGEDLAALNAYLAAGGKLVTSPAVGVALEGASRAGSAILYDGLVERRGSLYIAQKGVAVLFEDARHNVLAPFWRDLLGLARPRPGYRVVTERRALLYHLGPEPVQLRLTLPYEAYGTRFDADAQEVDRLRTWRLQATLGRREYLLVTRVPRSQPWID
jgi:hypothetical protein